MASLHIAAQPAQPAHTVRRLAVLSADVMGAQIAAHAANAGLPVTLFDLPAASGDKSAVARRPSRGWPS